MPLLGGLVVFIQFCFAFHALKTGRPYWWVFIIMGFPVMGCVVYYFVEVFPGSREHRRANRAARVLARVLQPDAELKKKAEELARSMSACCTLTTTRRPSGRRASCTCPSDALAIGTSTSSAKRTDTGFPSSDSMRFLISGKGRGGT